MSRKAKVPKLVDLTACGRCHRDFVQPIEWAEVGTTHWRIRTRCGNCGLTTWGVHDQATCDLFDDRLDALAEALIWDLRRFEHANLKGEADRFAAALAADLILPEDF